MDWLTKMDWQEAFTPTMSLLEAFTRGTAVFLILLVVLRIMRKQWGGISLADLLMIILIGNAVQNSIMADTKSITDGVLSALVIIGWSYALEYLGCVSSTWEKFIHPPPFLLMKEGEFLYKNMRREFITEDELMTQMREQGLEDRSKVKAAYLEGDGHISIIKKDS